MHARHLLLGSAARKPARFGVQGEVCGSASGGVETSLISYKALLTKEYRLFFLDGQPLYSVEYWEEGDCSGGQPPADLFAEVAQGVQSRFFTMDVAKRLDGVWLIMELGDGQVAGLPDRADASAFYRLLGEQLVPNG